MITPEECYAYWHKEYHSFEGKTVRAIKNFSKAKQRDYWGDFELFAQMVNRNNGKLNYKIFITALADQFGGYFHPCNLNKRRSLKIYRAYIKEKEANHSNQGIKDNIIRSLRFTIKFCIDNGIDNFYQYITHDMELIPSLLKHLNAGSTSPYFLALVPDLDMMLDSYPADVVSDFGSDLKINYSVYRTKIIHMEDKLIKNLINNFELQFEILIKSNKNKK